MTKDFFIETSALLPEHVTVSFNSKHCNRVYGHFAVCGRFRVSPHLLYEKRISTFTTFNRVSSSRSSKNSLQHQLFFLFLFREDFESFVEKWNLAKRKEDYLKWISRTLKLLLMEDRRLDHLIINNGPRSISCANSIHKFKWDFMEKKNIRTRLDIIASLPSEMAQTEKSETLMSNPYCCPVNWREVLITFDLLINICIHNASSELSIAYIVTRVTYWWGFSN